MNSGLLFVFWVIASRRLRWRQRPGKGQHPLCEHHTEGDVTVTSLCAVLHLLATSIPGIVTHSWPHIFQYCWGTWRACWLLSTDQWCWAVHRIMPYQMQEPPITSWHFCLLSKPFQNFFPPHFQEGKPQTFPLHWEVVKERKPVRGKKAGNETMGSWAPLPQITPEKSLGKKEGEAEIACFRWSLEAFQLWLFNWFRCIAGY